MRKRFGSNAIGTVRGRQAVTRLDLAGGLEAMGLDGSQARAIANTIGRRITAAAVNRAYRQARSIVADSLICD